MGVPTAVPAVLLRLLTAGYGPIPEVPAVTKYVRC